MIILFKIRQLTIIFFLLMNFLMGNSVFAQRCLPDFAETTPNTPSEVRTRLQTHYALQVGEATLNFIKQYQTQHQTDTISNQRFEEFVSNLLPDGKDPIIETIRYDSDDTPIVTQEAGKTVVSLVPKQVIITMRSSSFVESKLQGKTLNYRWVAKNWVLDSKEWCVNDGFSALPGPVITIQGFGDGTIIPNKPLVIIPSQANVGLEMHLTPAARSEARSVDVIVEHPFFEILTIPLQRKSDSQWHYTYRFPVPSELSQYRIYFTIHNHDLSVVETQSISLAIIKRTSLIDNILHVPVAVPTGRGQDIDYHAQLIPIAGSNTRFELDSGKLKQIENISIEMARYDPATGSVHIPRLDRHNESKSAQLQLVFPLTNPMQFELRF